MVLWGLTKRLLENMERLSLDKEPVRVETKPIHVDRSRISRDSQPLSLETKLP
jgi:hypothetical protein